MKNHCLLKIGIVIILFCNSAISQYNQWTWVGGYNTNDEFGYYDFPGSQPGGRYFSASFSANNKFYIHGGIGYAQSGSPYFLSDLWEFNPATSLWTWLSGSNATNQYSTYGTKGVFSTGNIPGARQQHASWVFNDKLYIFGGFAKSASGTYTDSNELWAYDLAANKWAWLTGSSFNGNSNFGTKGVTSVNNTPGHKIYMMSAYSNGSFYLFGGSGTDVNGSIGGMNDLWKYDPITNIWIWISGANTVLQPDNYGTIGVPAASNMIGARGQAGFWAINEKLYVFGGDFKSDLWEYNTLTNIWTWLKGPTTPFNHGTYGVMGQRNVLNLPGARVNPITWTENAKLYLRGGDGYGETSNGNLSDVWEYDPPTNSWTWINGSKEANQPKQYGTFNITSPTVSAGSANHTTGQFVNDKLYLFGGYVNIGSNVGYYADLFAYLPPCTTKTVKDGNWNDPTTWACGQVPTAIDEVFIYHQVTLSTIATVKNVRLNLGGNIIFNNGGNVQIK